MLSTRTLLRSRPLTLVRPLPFPRSPKPLTFSRFSSTHQPSPPHPKRPSPSYSTRSEGYRRAQQQHYAERNRSLLLYSAATILIVTASSYLAVPLYRVFCSTTGYAGTPVTDPTKFLKERLVARTDLDKRIKVQFNADSSDSLPWTFTPQQKEVRVLPGETALAFYTAKNLSDQDIIGIATYNVTPNNVSSLSLSLIFYLERCRADRGREVDTLDCTLFRKS